MNFLLINLLNNLVKATTNDFYGNAIALIKSDCESEINNAQKECQELRNKINSGKICLEMIESAESCDNIDHSDLFLECQDFINIIESTIKYLKIAAEELNYAKILLEQNQEQLGKVFKD